MGEEFRSVILKTNGFEIPEECLLYAVLSRFSPSGFKCTPIKKIFFINEGLFTRSKMSIENKGGEIQPVILEGCGFDCREKNQHMISVGA